MTRDPVSRPGGVMGKVWHLVVFVSILAVCVGCDRLAKVMAQNTLASHPPRSLLGGIVRLEYTLNPGAFMGLGARLPEAVRLPMMLLFVGIVFVATLVLVFRTGTADWPRFVGMSLFAAGGCGNLIDRLSGTGGVIDWVSIGVGPLRTGVFNLADLFIIGGVILFLWGTGGKKEEEHDHS
jgi:signal peptidase II